MKRRNFLQSSAAVAGAASMPIALPAWAQADRRKELLIVANELGPNSLDIHTVGANRAAHSTGSTEFRRGDAEEHSGLPVLVPFAARLPSVI